MQRTSSGFSTFLLVILGMGIFAGVLWFNSNNSAPITPVLPTQVQGTEEDVSIAQILDSNFASGATQVPTLELPQLQPTRQVVPQSSNPTATAIDASDASNQAQNVALPLGVTPTLAPEVVNAVQGTANPEDWQRPPLIPPLSLDPEGRDHYWFMRPIESNANSAPLDYYSFGADGFFGSTVHHGIDMPNDIGQIVYATAPGTVIFAADVRPETEPFDIFDNSQSYGNAVFIVHDFGFQGQRIYTVYAHLQRALVTENDVVQAGDPIGLVGETGRVSGPHIHFEVRIGGNGRDVHPRYSDTYNPILWMVPYVGTGVVAGRVVDSNGNYLDDVTVTIRNRTGVTRTTYSYVFQDTVDDINPDILWGENFAIGDIPVGRYDVIVTINDQRVIQQVDVYEGMTSFVVLRPPDAQAESTAETNGN
jgi:murein DD-endopeptidase MepM/ murein hydrolase activator NlpD